MPLPDFCELDERLLQHGAAAMSQMAHVLILSETTFPRQHTTEERGVAELQYQCL
jgi:hypothetical protein|tara:strand:+ start:111 stop:275 length:165 start_codon:yes stop_codon:yes gene_type:complete